MKRQFIAGYTISGQPLNNRFTTSLEVEFSEDQGTHSKFIAILDTLAEIHKKEGWDSQTGPVSAGVIVLQLLTPLN